MRLQSSRMKSMKSEILISESIAVGITAENAALDTKTQIIVSIFDEDLRNLLPEDYVEFRAHYLQIVGNEMNRAYRRFHANG
jgi:hypothetical protein